MLIHHVKKNETVLFRRKEIIFKRHERRYASAVYYLYTRVYIQWRPSFCCFLQKQPVFERTAGHKSHNFIVLCTRFTALFEPRAP